MIPQGTQPLGFYVNESSPGPGDLKIYNSEAHLNYDGFRFDGAATAITMVNDKAYGNRDGALVDNTSAVTYSYCHFYASSLAVAGSTDVEWTSGTGPIAGLGNVAQDTAPAVQVWQRYPAEVTLTVDDAGMTAGADTYYANTVAPIADAAGVPVGVAITVGYALAQTLVSEFQGWVNAGRDVTSHSMSHTYYTNTDALEVQYTGSGTAATLSISGKTLTITVTGASDSVSYNLAQGQPQGTIKGLRLALLGTGKFTATEIQTCQGPYGTGCSAYTEAALLAQDLADVSSQDVRTSVYHTQLDVTRLTTDEITLSRQWMTTNLTGLPATPVYVYPGGYETTTMQGITAGVPYAGARGALKEDLGVRDTYASGFNVQNITSFGVNPSWQGLQPTALNQKIQALVWKEQVWGVPWGIFWHLNELTNNDPVGGTEITNLIQDFKTSGATIQTNTGLVNWLSGGTQVTGTDGNSYYVLPATSMTLDFRPTKSSPVVAAGQNLGTAYALDINGVKQNSNGSRWEIGAHVYQGYTTYGGGTGSGHFTIGTNLLTGPPNYAGSSTSTGNPGIIGSIFTAASPTAASCSGMCQNSTGYDTSLNPSGTDPFVRVTDGSTSCAAAGQSFNATPSGGDNDTVWSKNSTYLAVTTTGGFKCILHLNLSGHAVQVMNTGTPGISIGGDSFSFSHVTDTRFYGIQSHTQIWQYDITSDSTTTSSQLVDVAGTGVCPGLPNPFGVTSGSIMTVSSSDDTFIFSLSNAGAQNTAVWTVAWSQTNGCSTVNMQTGSAWAFCTSSCTPSTPPLGTLNTSGGCWGAAPASPGGIHDNLGSLDGNYSFMTISGTWSMGACGGQSSGGYSVWQVGTTNSQWCSQQQTSIATGCVNHTSIGYTHAASNYFNGPNLRSVSNVSTATQFAPAYSPLLEDWHSAWPSGTSDTAALIVGTDLLNSGNGSGCANAVYCPIYQHNEIFAIPTSATYPPGGAFRRFGHTFSCGQGGTGKATCASGLIDSYFQGQQSILSVSQDGKYAALTSSMFGTLGNDSGGKPRQDIFVITLD